MWGLGGSNLNTSEPPAVWGGGRRGWHSQGSLTRRLTASCMWGGAGETDRWQRQQASSARPPPPHPARSLASLPLFYLRWSLLVSQFSGIPQLLGAHPTSGKLMSGHTTSQVNLRPGLQGSESGSSQGWARRKVTPSKRFTGLAGPCRGPWPPPR